MGIGYQRVDRRVVDYKLWYVSDDLPPLRGPRRFTSGNGYISFLGAAQTFGRFCKTPYPERLAQFFGKGFLNFGFGGCAPEYYLNKDKIISLVNDSEFCVLQLMSGRSNSNSVFDIVGLGGVLKFKYGPLEGQSFVAKKAYEQLLLNYSEVDIMQVIKETREVWVENTLCLLNRIEVPVILLWFSIRTPEYKFSIERVETIFGGFPQMVDRETLNKVVTRADHYIEVVTSTGFPQLLVNRHSAKPEEVFSKSEFPDRPDAMRCYNNYYPTADMHDEVFSALATYIIESKKFV